jgi:hypothetical protein
MCVLSNPVIGITATIYISSVICLATAGSTEEVIMSVLLVIVGGILADAMENEVLKDGQLKLYLVLIVSLNISFTVIFSYFLNMEPSYIYVIYGLSSGLIAAIPSAFIFKKLARKKITYVNDKINDILDEQYALARELKEFSKAEYQHARRVSAVASKCAEYVGVDAKLCAAAGMYYRIGILEGEPLSQTSQMVAKNACFPENVIKIIHEYGGEEALPSNIESAIVHMVDGLLKKMEVLHEQSTSSKWNQDMIIYQTLNDFSAKGLYDESGLSMNQFLKIREFLVNEEKLI